MADFERAYKYMIKNEVLRYGDPRCIYYSNDPDDKGGATAWGITEKAARAAGYTGDMIDLPESTAQDIYRREYWKYEGIRDQRVATKLLDMTVNFGPRRAILILQFLLWPGDPKMRDGKYGKKTEDAANAVAPEVLLEELRKSCVNYYNSLVRTSPDQAKFLTGWLRRANRMPEA